MFTKFLKIRLRVFREIMCINDEWLKTFNRFLRQHRTSFGNTCVNIAYTYAITACQLETKS